MGWRFRQSFSPIPGVGLTLSPSGISTSVGVGPLRFTTDSSGHAVTARIPGIGLSFHQPLAGAGATRAPEADRINTLPPGSAPAPPTAQPASPGLQEIKSGGSSALTTPGLAAFKQALAQAQQQHASVSSELEVAKATEQRHGHRFRGWQSRWLLRRIFKNSYAELEVLATDATDRRRELEEQLKLSSLPTDFEMPDAVAKAFARFCDDFNALGRSHKVWDNVAHRATNRVSERTTANRVIDRRDVAFRAGKCGVIETAMPVPHLQNANGGDLFFYPGFLVYFASATNFGLVEYTDLQVSVDDVHFRKARRSPATPRS